jgi:hypothetical protein
MGSITTITFFRFSSFRDSAWAFTQMQFAHSHLRKIDGLSFYKLMGSGRELGNPWPDWTTYAFLGSWINEEAANEFFANSEIFQKYKRHSIEQWTIYLKCINAKGKWSGGNPFTPSDEIDNANPLIAVVTRATIRPLKLIKFWRYAPTSQRPIQQGYPGLIYTKGIGETPLIQMATFSIWESIDALKKFAYQSQEHQVAIKKTRALDWYSEEMFIRFQPYRSRGIWGGKEMLSGFATTVMNAKENNLSNR